MYVRDNTFLQLSSAPYVKLLTHSSNQTPYMEYKLNKSLAMISEERAAILSLKLVLCTCGPVIR